MSNTDKLHKHVQKMFGLFTKDLGMTIPPLSHAPLLYRWLLELTLPIECYAGALRLCRSLDLKFASAPDARVSTGKVALTYPEVRLMAVLVVTTKLLFPLDDAQRYPSSATDLSALSIDWPAWSTVQTSSEPRRPGLYGHSEAMQSKEVHLQADNGDLDDYLDWAEENVASEDVREYGKPGKDAEFRRKLFRIFAIDFGRENTASKPWDSDQEADDFASAPTHRQPRGEVEEPLPNYQARRASQETVHPAGAQSKIQTAREYEGQAGRGPDAHRNSQSNADRLPPALLRSSRAKPSQSTNTPKVTGSLSTKRIVEDQGAERFGGAVSNDACSAHGVMNGDIDRAGSFYRRFRSVEELSNGAFGTGTSVAKIFHERAADVVGVSLEALVKAVCLIEEMVSRWEEAVRRTSAVRDRLWLSHPLADLAGYECRQMAIAVPHH
ncbi:hypothetical protein EJ03DRAFT_325086 [Teratosphaeria nubilosa]|uniref:Rrn7/TAF1B C-terminal cyclin domain-containing protein n=1 Tax=Teratosphaeria nubilosa TaxID=161662 RepID=A0A6G1LGX1_9PEZI|nr:hypothetical protein EJ03DRAFT_325086 [Teratosphaeria nubilosa]